MNKFCILFSALVALAALLHTSQLSAAESESPVPAMDALVTDERYLESYQLGTEQLAQWEGDAEFDFLYGLSALEVGEANEAVFALERVAATAATGLLRDRARLELARAYFVTNNLSAAENLFNSVLESNPPANVQQNIRAFLVLIASRRDRQEASLDFTLSSFIGSDDNINSATSNSFIDTPLIGQIELNPDGQETADEFLNTTANLTYSYPFSRNQSLTAAVNLMHLDNFGTDQFDIDTLRAEFAYNWGNANNRIRHGIAVNKVNLDQNGFQDSISINSSWQHAGANGWYQSLAASYARIRYDTGNGGDLNDLRDVNQALLTAGITKIHGAFTHALNLYHADEDPDNSNGGDHNGRRFTGLAYSLLYRLNGQHTPYFRASTQEVRHDSEHPVFFDTTRADDMVTSALGWLWQINQDFLISAEASFTDNSSNLELFDYSRFKYQVGFRYQF